MLCCHLPPFLPLEVKIGGSPDDWCIDAAPVAACVIVCGAPEQRPGHSRRRCGFRQIQCFGCCRGKCVCGGGGALPLQHQGPRRRCVHTMANMGGCTICRGPAYPWGRARQALVYAGACAWALVCPGNPSVSRPPPPQWLRSENLGDTSTRAQPLYIVDCSFIEEQTLLDSRLNMPMAGA